MRKEKQCSINQNILNWKPESETPKDKKKKVKLKKGNTTGVKSIVSLFEWPSVVASAAKDY